MLGPVIIFLCDVSDEVGGGVENSGELGVVACQENAVSWRSVRHKRAVKSANSPPSRAK